MERDRLSDFFRHPAITSHLIHLATALRTPGSQSLQFFGDDIAPLLIFLNLLGQLKVDNLSGGKAIAILFRFIGSKYVPKLVIAAPTNYSRILLSTSAS